MPVFVGTYYCRYFCLNIRGYNAQFITICRSFIFGCFYYPSKLFNDVRFAVVDVVCRNKIGLAVLELLESGELLKLKKKWWFDKGECPVDVDSKVISQYQC